MYFRGQVECCRIGVVQLFVCQPCFKGLLPRAFHAAQATKSAPLLVISSMIASVYLGLCSCVLSPLFQLLDLSFDRATSSPSSSSVLLDTALYKDVRSMSWLSQWWLVRIRKIPSLSNHESTCSRNQKLWKHPPRIARKPSLDRPKTALPLRIPSFRSAEPNRSIRSSRHEQWTITTR